MSGQNLEIYGGGVAAGLSHCGVAPTRITGPLAFQLPGGTTSQMAIKTGFRFPTTPFTVEGFVNVAPGSGGRYMFSYNAVGNDNCILVRSTVGTYGVWVHWAMTIGSNNAITHYINGVVNTGLRYTRTFCGTNGGALVLGHDQVRCFAPCLRTSTASARPRIISQQKDRPLPRT
jgi:hypothetical protein